MRTKCSWIMAVAVAVAPIACWGQTSVAPSWGAPTAAVPPGQVAGGWPAPKKPSFGERVKNAFTNNPATKAWEALRKDDKRPSPPPQRDVLSLSNRTLPPSPDLLIAAAKLSERNGQVDRAREQFHRALTMAPTHVEGLIEFGRLEDRQGRLDVAERHYRTAVNLNPHHATALNDLALCLARQGKLDESVDLLQQAINIHPDKALYRNNIATVLVEQRRDQEALTHLTAVHGPAVANYNLGLLLSKRGRPQDAEQYFVAALQIDPQMSQASDALAALGRPVPQVATSSPMNMQPMHAAEPQGPRFVAPQAAVSPRPATAYVPQRGAMRTLPPVHPTGVPWSR